MQSPDQPTDQSPAPNPVPNGSPGTSPSAMPTRPGSSSKSWLPKLVIGVAVIFVILLIGYGLNRPKSKTTTSTTKQATQIQNADVTITKAGFVPATIEVSAGTQVIWTNTDTAVHQVAADPYPKNDSIPDFDSTVILQAKDSTSFTFDKAGTYTYHDERNPQQFKGTVIVK